MKIKKIIITCLVALTIFLSIFFIVGCSSIEAKYVNPHNVTIYNLNGEEVAIYSADPENSSEVTVIIYKGGKIEIEHHVGDTNKGKEVYYNAVIKIQE